MRELIVAPDRLGLRCGIGSYFAALDTCDALAWELLRATPQFTSSRADAFQRFEQQLPLRSAQAAQVANPVRDGRARSAALAVITLLAYNDAGTFHLWLRRRSADVSRLNAGLVHLRLPRLLAGGF